MVPFLTLFQIFLPVYRLCNMQMILNMYYMFVLLFTCNCDHDDNLGIVEQVKYYM